MRGILARSMLAAAVVAALIIGIARSATSRYNEQRRAILSAAAAERKRLGLTDRKALFAAHPSPEIKLCRGVAVLPGATAEVVVQGKFEPGTKFLFENDSLEVVKENVGATEYRATVSAARNLGPNYAYLNAFAPVSAGNGRCLAVVVGGKYEWGFTAENGLRVRLTPVSQKAGQGSEGLPMQVYRAEFFRGTEAKPFASFDAALNMEAAPREDGYSADWSSAPRQESSSKAEMEMKKLQQQMESMHKLTEKEQEQLIERMQKLAAGAMAEAVQQQTQMQQHERSLEELGCREIKFRLGAEGATGNLRCRDAQGVGRSVGVKGTMKFLGPW